MIEMRNILVEKTKTESGEGIELTLKGVAIIPSKKDQDGENP